MASDPQANLAGIPAELRQLPQWVCWRLEPRRGETKPTKVPYDAKTGRKALPSSDDDTHRQTWAVYDQAVAAVGPRRMSGIGFVFSEDDPYVGIDLDHVRDPETGAIEPWAMAVIERIDSYTEASQSGTGVHIIAQGVLPGPGHKTGPRECYDQERYFVFTGQVLDGRDRIHWRQRQVAEWYRETWPAKAPEPTPRPEPAEPIDLDDREIIDRAMRAKNGAGFARLWAGDASGHAGGDGKPDESAADFALCGRLYYWTGGDPVRMDRLFRQSGLMRPKWDERHGRQTYGELTIANILKAGGPVYDPARMRRLSPAAEEHQAAGCDCGALQRRIAYLEEVNAAQRETIQQERAERQNIIAVLANPELRPNDKVVLILAELRYSTEYRRNAPEDPAKDDGFRPVYLAGDIAKAAGVSAGTASKSLAKLESWGLASRQRRKVQIPEGVNRVTGELTGGARNIIYLKFPDVDLATNLQALSRASEERPARKPGTGLPLACPDHPEGHLVMVKQTRVECSECRRVLDQGEEITTVLNREDLTTKFSASDDPDTLTVDQGSSATNFAAQPRLRLIQEPLPSAGPRHLVHAVLRAGGRLAQPPP